MELRWKKVRRHLALSRTMSVPVMHAPKRMTILPILHSLKTRRLLAAWLRQRKLMQDLQLKIRRLVVHVVLHIWEGGIQSWLNPRRGTTRNSMETPAGLERHSLALLRPLQGVVQSNVFTFSRCVYHLRGGTAIQNSFSLTFFFFLLSK